jgi:hypothetical protein
MLGSVNRIQKFDLRPASLDTFLLPSTKLRAGALLAKTLGTSGMGDFLLSTKFVEYIN